MHSGWSPDVMFGLMNSGAFFVSASPCEIPRRSSISSVVLIEGDPTHGGSQTVSM